MWLDLDDRNLINLDNVKHIYVEAVDDDMFYLTICYSDESFTKINNPDLNAALKSLDILRKILKQQGVLI